MLKATFNVAKVNFWSAVPIVESMTYTNFSLVLLILRADLHRSESFELKHPIRVLFSPKFSYTVLKFLYDVSLRSEDVCYPHHSISVTKVTNRIVKTFQLQNTKPSIKGIVAKQNSKRKRCTFQLRFKLRFQNCIS